MRIATASLIHRGNRQNNDLSKLPEHKKSDTPAAVKLGRTDSPRLSVSAALRQRPPCLPENRPQPGGLKFASAPPGSVRFFVFRQFR
jgi:hypothetical protein